MTTDFKHAATVALCKIALRQRSRLDQERWLGDLADVGLISRTDARLMFDGDSPEAVLGYRLP